MDVSGSVCEKRTGVWGVLVDKPVGKWPLGKYRHRWEDNVKM